MSDSNPPRTAFKVRIGDYLTEHELEGLGVSADWFLYLSPTIAPALATCFTQFNTYKLLACPCCGGTATIIGTYPTNEFSAICRDCGLETAHKLTPKDAASNWNKRHAPDEGPAGIKTPEPNQMDAMLTDKPQNATIVPCDVCRQPNRIGHDCTPPESGGQGDKCGCGRPAEYEANDGGRCCNKYGFRCAHPPAQASGAVTEAVHHGFGRMPMDLNGKTYLFDARDAQVWNWCREAALAQGGGNGR